LIDGAHPDFSNERSLHNWITDFDMFCLAPFRVSLFGALYFAGIILGMIILAFTSKYGRKINLIVSSWVTLAVVILIVAVSNLYTRYLGMFLLGVCMIQKITAYIVATEIAPFRNQIAVATAILAFDNITFPLSAIYFKFISDEWIYMGYFAIVFSLIMAIGSIFTPESPRFLVDNGEFDKAKKCFYTMSKMNKSSLNSQSWKFKEQMNTHKSFRDDDEKEELLLSGETLVEEGSNINVNKMNPIKQMMNSPKLSLNLSIATVCWIACSFNYFLLSYDIKNLGGNIFLNSSLIAIAGVSGKLITLGVRKYTSSKISLLICFTVVLISGFGLIFFKEGWMVSASVGMVLIGIGGAFTLTYFLNNEYFPPLFLGFAFSVTQFGSRSMSILSYLMADLEEPIPMILL